ncbi:UNKNOWN [Stylonychia lemnae]|uniref:Uncharacterized protein n=1 Tax=Stylonychia lemnae TaxID=5949 RepID=A0A078AHE2_STYLE|nr:UNKNOWN [Stylonychia lemnae]|eukprot:CDW80912.1 UNKNOWN [Stylonychia lemnae]
MKNFLKGQNHNVLSIENCKKEELIQKVESFSQEIDKRSYQLLVYFSGKCKIKDKKNGNHDYLCYLGNEAVDLKQELNSIFKGYNFRYQFIYDAYLTDISFEEQKLMREVCWTLVNDKVNNVDQFCMIHSSTYYKFKNFEIKPSCSYSTDMLLYILRDPNNLSKITRADQFHLISIFKTYSEVLTYPEYSKDFADFYKDMIAMKGYIADTKQKQAIEEMKIIEESPDQIKLLDYGKKGAGKLIDQLIIDYEGDISNKFCEPDQCLLLPGQREIQWIRFIYNDLNSKQNFMVLWSTDQVFLVDLLENKIIYTQKFTGDYIYAVAFVQGIRILGLLYEFNHQPYLINIDTLKEYKVETNYQGSYLAISQYLSKYLVLAPNNDNLLFYHDVNNKMLIAGKLSLQKSQIFRDLICYKNYIIVLKTNEYNHAQVQIAVYVMQTQPNEGSNQAFVVGLIYDHRYCGEVSTKLAPSMPFNLILNKDRYCQLSLIEFQKKFTIKTQSAGVILHNTTNSISKDLYRSMHELDRNFKFVEFDQDDKSCFYTIISSGGQNHLTRFRIDSQLLDIFKKQE